MVGKSVAIIGGGQAGLAAAKSFREFGLCPTIFEATAYLGGLWSPGSSRLHQSLRTNVSKYICCFSDFPWDSKMENDGGSETSMFPSAAQVGNYLNNYASHFLKDDNCIRLNTPVTHADFSQERSQWRVKFERVEHPVPPRQGEDYFDFLVIASGFFTRAFIPSIPGLGSFKGQVYHSSQADILLSQGKLDLSRKSVAVIGGSFSGVEVAASLGPFLPRRIVHVTKKPFWLLPRYLPEDPTSIAPAFLPIDLVLTAKIQEPSPPTTDATPLSLEDQNRKRNEALGLFGGNQSLISANLEVGDEDVGFLGISDNYAELVRNGDIQVVLGEICEVDGSSLRFLSEPGQPSEVDDIDVIIFATGFATELPYFDASTLASIGYDGTDLFQPLLLYSGIFHPHLPQCAFIGMYRGPSFAVIELQSRYVAGIFNGSLPWPSAEVQWEGIQEEEKIRNEYPRSQIPHGDYVGCVNLIVKLSSAHEEPNLGYAIPPKYSPLPVATDMIQSFQADLTAMREGKFVPAAVFRNLHGTWHFQRHEWSRTGGPVVATTGVATFTPVHNSTAEIEVEAYLYREDDSGNTTTTECIYELVTASNNNMILRQGNEAFEFTRDMEAGWKGTTVVLDDDGVTHSYEYIFPFQGLYFPTFTKRLIGTSRMGDGDSHELLVTRNTDAYQKCDYFRKILNFEK